MQLHVDSTFIQVLAEDEGAIDGTLKTTSEDLGISCRHDSFFSSFLLNKVAGEWGGGSTSRGISIKPFIDLGSLASSKKPGPFPVLRQHSSSCGS